MEQTESIFEVARRMKDSYVSGKTQTGKYVSFNLHEHIEKIHAYTNATHTSGEVDSLGREKPFFDITTAAVNIWYRATDIDRKNIRIYASKVKRMLAAFAATQHLQLMMKKMDFGTFLNKWGRTLAIYGSAVVKCVEKDGDLDMSVVPWNRIICDAIDFENNPQIEILYLTKAQLRKNKSYNQEVVEALLNADGVRKQLDGSHRDNKAGYFEVMEIHGEFPNSLLDENDESGEYSQQIQVVASLRTGKGKDDYEDFTLYSGKEEKSVYMLTHLLEEEGRVIGKGAVEYLFDSQWMANHSIKLIKDNLDLISKMILITADPALGGQNLLTSIETGDFLVSKERLDPMQFNAQSIPLLQNFAAQWQNQAKEISATPDAISGNTMPSGTAYRQVAILNQESHSLYEQMVESKGLFIERMVREWIIPNLKKKLDSAEEIRSTLEAHDLAKIDSMFIDAEADKMRFKTQKETILGGNIAEEFDLEGAKQEVKKSLDTQGGERYLVPSDISDKTWKEFLKDFEWDAEVEVTGESQDKEALLTTLTTVLQNVTANPNILESPYTKFIFNKILEISGGVSPVELSSIQSVQQPPQPIPNQQIKQPQPIGGT
jgi:hypothetical protein